jgi:hypothetical protein
MFTCGVPYLRLILPIPLLHRSSKAGCGNWMTPYGSSPNGCLIMLHGSEGKRAHSFNHHCWRSHKQSRDNSHAHPRLHWWLSVNVTAGICKPCGFIQTFDESRLSLAKRAFPREGNDLRVLVKIATSNSSTPHIEKFCSKACISSM